MYEEDTPQSVPSKSAFSGTSDVNPNFPFEMLSRAYLIRATGRVRFDLWKPAVEKLSGVTFERGRMYTIRGAVNGRRFESRHVAGRNHVYVFADGGTPGVMPGETCRLLVEALEEKRRFAVVMGKRGPVVRFSGPSLRGFGVPIEESCMGELRLVRSGERVARRVFARWNPLLGFMELQMGGAGFAVGDTVEVVGGRRYDVDGFVEDFRAHRLHELSNVELGVEGGSLTAAVDGRRVPVEQHWLTTHGLKAALKMKLGYDHMEMKLVFDGSSVEAKFGNSDRILEWSAAGRGVDVRYSRGAGQAYVMRLEERPLPGVSYDLDWLAEGIRVVERPSIPQGRYLLEMSEAVREISRQKLNTAANEKSYAKLRGDIGEGIVKLLLPEMRMELLYDHPWSELSGRYGSRRGGPDLMVECQGLELTAYVEVKWQEDVVKAFLKAKNQVLDYFRLLRTPKGRKVDGAYIAVVDWKLAGLAGLWVERVA